MEITSLYFIVLSVLSVFIFYLINPKYRIIFLLVIGFCFIATYSYLLLIYIVLYSLINYYIGIIIAGSRFSRLAYRIGILLNLFQLVILRYSSFLIDPFFHLFGSNINVSQISGIIVPVGVSFFTLQGIGYLINIKMGWEKPEKNLISFLLYITFYPKFLSGPIERSNHFLPQLKQISYFNESIVTNGFRMVLIGIFKKVAIANQLAPLITSANANVNLTDVNSLWLIFLLQPLYLYFDFSGYTDIAIGLAKTYGIDLMPNFNRPFLSENVTTFWKRFHISLSSWFNDYIFRQASFKFRKWGVYASILSMFVTWILFGIWHGAGWNFMVLGFLQALAIILEFFTKKVRIKLFSKVHSNLRIWIGRITTYLFYALSLVFFFSKDINSVFTFLSKLFTSSNNILLGVRWEIFLLVIIFIMIFLLIEILNNDFQNIYNKLESIWTNNKMQTKLIRWFLYLVLLAFIIVLSNDVQQFIYFQF